jgi:hypothetical protein
MNGGQVSLPLRRPPWLRRRVIFVELNGIEPMTSGLQSQRSPN